MKTKKSIIVLIDSKLTAESPPFKEIKEKEGHNIKHFAKINEGINYIQENLNKKLIVILDINFSENEQDGFWWLQEIRKKSSLIPVIILTFDKYVKKHSDIINNKLFAYVNKRKINDIKQKIAEAENMLNNSVAGALEEWISVQEKEKREKPYMIFANGSELTLEQILKEVREQSRFGQEFIKDLNALTIHLLLNKKVNL